MTCTFPTAGRVFLVWLFACVGTQLASADLVGQWDFNNPSDGLAATAGPDLSFASAFTRDRTDFGSTTEFGIPPIDGAVAQVMLVPDLDQPEDGYGIALPEVSNGGGSEINQWTLILDIYFPSLSHGNYTSLFQTGSGDSDGDFFVNPEGKIGISQQYTDGDVYDGQWHRIAVAVDLSASGDDRMRKFVDGVSAGSQDVGGGIDGRFALPSGGESRLFADNSGEIEEAFVNSVQLWYRALSDAEVAALGGPTAGGLSPAGHRIEGTLSGDVVEGVTIQLSDGQETITDSDGTYRFEDLADGAYTVTPTLEGYLFTPASQEVTLGGGDVAGVDFSAQIVPAGPPALIGQWDFDDPLDGLAATAGPDLGFLSGNTAAMTTFLSTDGVSIPHLDGEVARVMCVPDLDSSEDGYAIPLPDLSNGGGAEINQWTLILDIYFPTASHGDFRSLLQTDPDNSDDGDFFVNGAGGIGIDSNYDGDVDDGRWHRIAVAVDLSASVVDQMRKYIDGVLEDSQDPPGGLDGRFALKSAEQAILFGDESGEVEVGYVNSVQLWHRALAGSEIAALGGPTADGLPVPPGAGAGELCFSLGFQGSFGDPTIELTNTSSRTLQITGLEMTIGDTGKNFDRVVDITAPAGTEATVLMPDLDNDGVRSDVLVISFSGLPPGETIRIQVDLDDDDLGNTDEDYRRVFFRNGPEVPNSEITVTAGMQSVTLTLPGGLDAQDSYLFHSKAPEPGVALRILEIRLDEDDVRLTFTTDAARSYQVESSLDLIRWSSEGTSFPGSGDVESRSISRKPGVASEFYRIREVD